MKTDVRLTPKSDICSRPINGSFGSTLAEARLPAVLRCTEISQTMSQLGQ
jgi:hypothetical protein